MKLWYDTYPLPDMIFPSHLVLNTVFMLLFLLFFQTIPDELGHLVRLQNLDLGNNLIARWVNLKVTQCPKSCFVFLIDDMLSTALKFIILMPGAFLIS